VTLTAQGIADVRGGAGVPKASRPWKTRGPWSPLSSGTEKRKKGDSAPKEETRKKKETTPDQKRTPASVGRRRNSAGRGEGAEHVAQHTDGVQHVR